MSRGLLNHIKLVFYLYFVGIVSPFENKFLFNENCSIRVFNSNNISRCISCYHTKTVTAIYFPCSSDRISDLPESMHFLSHQLLTTSSGATCLMLSLETSQIQKLESVDIKMYWNRPLHDSDGFEGFDSNIIHRSTMKFLEYTRPKEENFDSKKTQKISKRVVFSVKFCGVFDFGSYDIRLLSHPNCYMRGLSPWYFVDLGKENKTRTIFPKIDPETPTNECPLPETLTTRYDSHGDNLEESVKPKIACLVLVMISIISTTFCCLSSIAVLRYIFTKFIKKKPPQTSTRRASVESRNIENPFDERLMSKHGVKMSSCKDFTAKTSQQSSAHRYIEVERPPSSLCLNVEYMLSGVFVKKLNVKSRSLAQCGTYNTSNSDPDYVEVRMSTSSLYWESDWITKNWVRILKLFLHLLI